MGIGDSITLASCLAGTMLALPAFLIFINLALVETSEKAMYRVKQGGCMPFVVGSVIVLFVGAPAVGLISAGSIFQFMGSIVATALALGGFLGLSAIARLVGRRLTEMAEQNYPPLLETVTGAFILSFAIMFPLLGWFVLLPLSFITGIGAIVLVMVNRIWGAPQPQVQGHSFIKETPYYPPIPPSESPTYVYPDQQT